MSNPLGSVVNRGTVASDLGSIGKTVIPKAVIPEGLSGVVSTVVESPPVNYLTEAVNAAFSSVANALGFSNAVPATADNTRSRVLRSSDSCLSEVKRNVTEEVSLINRADICEGEAAVYCEIFGDTYVPERQVDLKRLAAKFGYHADSESFSAMSEVLDEMDKFGTTYGVAKVKSLVNSAKSKIEECKKLAEGSSSTTTTTTTSTTTTTTIPETTKDGLKTTGSVTTVKDSATGAVVTTTNSTTVDSTTGAPVSSTEEVIAIDPETATTTTETTTATEATDTSPATTTTRTSITTEATSTSPSTTITTTTTTEETSAAPKTTIKQEITETTIDDVIIKVTRVDTTKENIGEHGGVEEETTSQVRTIVTKGNNTVELTNERLNVTKSGDTGDDDDDHSILTIIGICLGVAFSVGVPACFVYNSRRSGSEELSNRHSRTQNNPAFSRSPSINLPHNTNITSTDPLYGNVGRVPFPAKAIQEMSYYDGNWFIEVEQELDSGLRYHHRKNVTRIKGVDSLDADFDPKSISTETEILLGNIEDSWSESVDIGALTKVETQKLYDKLTVSGGGAAAADNIEAFKARMPEFETLKAQFQEKMLADFEQLQPAENNFYNILKGNPDLTTLKGQFKAYANTACPRNSLAFNTRLGLFAVQHGNQAGKRPVYQCAAPKPNPKIGHISVASKIAAVQTMRTLFNEVGNAHDSDYVRCVSCSQELGSGSKDTGQNKFTPFYAPAPDLRDSVAIDGGGRSQIDAQIQASDIGIEGNTSFRRVTMTGTDSPFTVDFRYWLSDGKGVFHAHVVDWVDLQAITPSELAFFKNEFDRFVTETSSGFTGDAAQPSFEDIPLITHCTAGVGRSGVMAAALKLLDHSILDGIATGLKDKTMTGGMAFANMKEHLDTVITDGRKVRNVQGYVDADQKVPDTRAMFVQTEDQYASLLAYCMEYVANKAKE